MIFEIFIMVPTVDGAEIPFPTTWDVNQTPKIMG